MSIYTGNHLKATQLKRQDQTVTQWLETVHLKELDNLRQDPQLLNPDISTEDKLKRLKQLKKDTMPFAYATAFGEKQAPKTPDSAPRKVKDNGGILRRFIALDYDLEAGQEDQLETLWQNLHTLFIEQNPVNLAVYPSSSYPLLPRLRIVVETQEWLDKRTYKSAAEFLINLLGVDTNDFQSNTSLAHAFNAPWYWHPKAREKSLFVTHKDALSLESLGWVAPRSKGKQEDTKVPYRPDQLEPAIQAFVEDPHTRDQLQDYDYFWRLAESLADAHLSNLVSDSFVNQTLEAVALGNDRWAEDNHRIFHEQVAKLQQNPDKRSYVKPLGTYLPIVDQVKAQDPSITNLARLLASFLPPQFDADLEIKEACDLISQYFEFGLLPGIESNQEALAIFNPLSGLWVHSEDDLIAMLTVVKPALHQGNVNTAIMYWAAQANKADRYLKPYSGSRYLAFKNGVLDIISGDLLPLNHDTVKGLELTSRHLIQIDYTPEPTLITYPNDGINGGDWNIDQFISAYADNNPEIKEYLLFGLSLGLFPNHTFGVTFDIQGESGSGKSTLSTIYKGLYGPKRVQEIIFSDMNKDFPLNSYNYDTAVIWAKECNIGSNDLSDEYGVNFYDSLSDPSARIPVKHAGDIIVENPPQLFVDGTVFISADELNSGVSRRTLAFKLPSPMDALRDQYYSNNILDHLMEETTLQWLVVEMIKAYKSVVPDHRWANFKMNLGLKSDVALLPKAARDWRYEFVSADANLRLFFEDQVKEALLVDDPLAWVNDDFFHRVYLGYYAQKNPQDKSYRFAKRLPNFTKILHQIFEEEGLIRIEYRDSGLRNRKRISNYKSWGFDWDTFLEMWMMPENLETGNAPEIYNKKVAGMYRLVTRPPESDDYTLTKDGAYVPNKPTNQLT